MIDWQRLEQEMAELHHSERLADRIVRSARRHRARRGVLTAACAALVAAAIIVPVLAGGDHGAGPAQQAAGARGMNNATAGSSVSPQTRAEIYAAALTPAARPVWVRDHVCNGVPTSLASSPCRDAPIPPAVQQEVVDLLGSTVHFAANPPVPRSAQAATVVGFGRLQVNGNRARLGVEMLCGLMCGEGETLVLRSHGGRWQVSGSVGPAWVS